MLVAADVVVVVVAAVAVVGAAISAAWGAVGVWLGKRFDSVKETRTKDE